MENRTCEAYVLNLLDRRENEIEELKEQIVTLEDNNATQSLTIGRLISEESRLNELIDFLLGHLDVNDSHIGCYVWSGDPDYDVIKRLKKEREPNSEENDSQNNVSEL